MAEQRHQRRHEEHVARAHRAGAGDRLARDARVADRGSAGSAACGTSGLLMCASASAASRRPTTPAPRVSAIRRDIADLGGMLAVGLAGIGQRHRGGDDDARLGVVEVARMTAAASSLRERGQRPHGRGADVGVVVAQHPLRRPASSAPRAPSRADFERDQRAGADLRRLVMQEQRRDQMPLVERLQHVDRVEHRALVAGATAPRPASRSSPDRRRRAAASPAPSRACPGSGGTTSGTRAGRRAPARSTGPSSPGSRSSADASRAPAPTA